MSNILFINANLHGHINPTLPLVRKLVENGNHVDYFCSQKFREKVSAEGASYIDYSDEMDEFLASYRPTDRHPFYMLMEYILLYAEVMIPRVMKIEGIEKYDMLICDSLFGGPIFLKQLLKMPVISSHSSFAMSRAPVPMSMLEPGSHPQLDHCYSILERICTGCGIPVPELTDVFTSKADWNVVYTTPEFNGDPGIELSRYLFAGPVIPQEINREFEGFINGDERKVIYISLGSINTDFADFFRMCIRAFEDSDYYVVMSIGRKCDIEQLGDIPPNFYVGNFLPQLAVLKNTDVFITHAGFNSVSEALYFGVPMYALPMVNDQHMVAKRIKDMEFGLIGMFTEISPQILRDKVEELLSDEQIRLNCRKMSEMIRGSDRLSLTAGKLTEIASGRAVPGF